MDPTTTWLASSPSSPSSSSPSSSRFRRWGARWQRKKKVTEYSQGDERRHLPGKLGDDGDRLIAPHLIAEATLAAGEGPE
mmetsp:Transcript_63146/g.126732  ORF Transcript_63146/g.126732 Transcript_63146/m.126732 type:complete len:80 (-) Transcript_63146:18-257(-)